MSKGDIVRVLVDKGAGSSEWFEVEATVNGQTIDVERDDRKGLVRIDVLGATGKIASQNVFRLDRVLVLKEIRKVVA